ncbi:MAG TPA: hypothetical protein VGP72_27470 [Planctomycetota bacterium]
MSAAQQKFFSGDDRLETVLELGRPFRMGTPQSLKSSNVQRIREALFRQDAASAELLLNYIHPLDSFMTAAQAEWIFKWVDFLAARLGASASRTVAELAFKLWREGLEDNSARQADIAHTLSKELHPNSVCRVATHNEESVQGSIAVVRKRAEETFLALRNALSAGRYVEAIEALGEYCQTTRQTHDLLATYLWALPSATCSLFGQKVAEGALEGSFNSMSLQDQMWQSFESLAPAARAAFLAEHLRFHFTGPDRDGTVEIIEEPECYRLVFDPCGSGGAMRRNMACACRMTIFEDASPLTWGRAKEVPAYCAHCASNELTSIKRNGYPLWVTEFDPDASRPCGWTVYKDRSLIPPRYFSRLTGSSRQS